MKKNELNLTFDKYVSKNRNKLLSNHYKHIMISKYCTERKESNLIDEIKLNINYGIYDGTYSRTSIIKKCTYLVDKLLEKDSLFLSIIYDVYSHLFVPYGRLCIFNLCLKLLKGNAELDIYEEVIALMQAESKKPSAPCLQYSDKDFYEVEEILIKIYRAKLLEKELSTKQEIIKKKVSKI